MEEDQYSYAEESPFKEHPKNSTKVERMDTWTQLAAAERSAAQDQRESRARQAVYHQITAREQLTVAETLAAQERDSKLQQEARERMAIRERIAVAKQSAA
jgi:hypothetical protein